MGINTSEYCPHCGEMVQPFFPEENVGVCPICRNTTKDLVNNVQTGPDYCDVPESTSPYKSKLTSYSREPKDRYNGYRRHDHKHYATPEAGR